VEQSLSFRPGFQPVSYGEYYGFIGFFIVKPDVRGRGYGFGIWQAGMKKLEDRVIGLDGVTTQQDNYQKSGFVLAHRNIRFGGTPRACNSSGCKTHSNRLRVGAADSRLRSSLLSR
jgi:hypothetical protein